MISFSVTNSSPTFENYLQSRIFGSSSGSNLAGSSFIGAGAGGTSPYAVPGVIDPIRSALVQPSTPIGLLPAGDLFSAIFRRVLSMPIGDLLKFLGAEGEKPSIPAPATPKPLLATPAPAPGAGQDPSEPVSAVAGGDTSQPVHAPGDHPEPAVVPPVPEEGPKPAPAPIAAEAPKPAPAPIAAEAPKPTPAPIAAEAPKPINPLPPISISTLPLSGSHLSVFPIQRPAETNVTPLQGLDIIKQIPTLSSPNALSAPPENFFGPAEYPGIFLPIFNGFYGSGSSGIAGGRLSGPMGGLDGYGGGFKGPVGGVYGTIVGYNDGTGQGGPMGGLYSTLLGTMGWGEGGFGGGGFFPGGMFSQYGYPS